MFLTITKYSTVRRAAFALCAASFSLVATAPAHAQAMDAMAPLPTTSIALKADVARVEGGIVELSSGWQQGLAVGMLLDLSDGAGGVVGRVRLVEVMPQRARGELLTSRDASSARSAVAPYPLAITRIDGKNLNFSVPSGNRALQVGDTLTIVRNGQAIGRAQFRGYSPIAATVTTLSPGTVLRTGDALWAYNDAGTAIAAVPVANNAVSGQPASETAATTPAAGDASTGETSDAKKSVTDVFSQVNSENDAPELRENKKYDYILAAAAAAYALTSNSRQNSDRPLNDTRIQFSAISALPGGGFGITREGLIGPGGAMQVNIPVAYTPRKPTLLIGGYAAQNTPGDSITTDIGRNGTGMIGGGGKLGGRGIWLSRMLISTVSLVGGDSSYNASVELAGETATRPAIAFGFQDIKGTFKRSPFVVATKSVGDEKPLYLTLGVGGGRFNGSRVFGGVSYSPVRKLSLAAEFDGVQANLGATFALGSRLFLLASYNDLFQNNKGIQKGDIVGRRYQVGATLRLF
jgi:hypothetical protein